MPKPETSRKLTENIDFLYTISKLRPKKQKSQTIFGSSDNVVPIGIDPQADKKIPDVQRVGIMGKTVS
jgi:hypothetical protein